MLKKNYIDKKALFGVCLTLDYDHMFSESDFTKEESNFQPTTGIANSSLLHAAALSQKWSDSGLAEAYRV